MASISLPVNFKKLLDAQTASINSNTDTKTTAVSSAVNSTVTTKATETQAALIADNDVTQAQLNGMTTVNGTLDTNVTAINNNTDAQHVTTKALVTSEADREIAATPSTIKSIQRGMTFISNGVDYIDVTVTNVNLSKTVLNYLGDTANTPPDAKNGAIISLINSTTIRITAYRPQNGQHKVSWELVEYV